MFKGSQLTLVIITVTVLVMGVGAYKVHTWRVEALKAEWQALKIKDIATAKAEMQLICDKNNKITKENAYALKAKLNTTTDRYNRLLKYGADCSVGKVAPTSGGYNGAPRAAVPTLCIPIIDLATYGKHNDEQAAALTTLQDVVASIYCQNEQKSLLPATYTCR